MVLIPFATRIRGFLGTLYCLLGLVCHCYDKWCAKDVVEFFPKGERVRLRMFGGVEEIAPKQARNGRLSVTDTLLARIGYYRP